LIVNNVPGADMNLDPDKINAYKKFANKIWNIARFVLDATGDNNNKLTAENLTSSDAENIKNHLASAVTEITNDMNNNRFDLASEKIYHFIWDYFASTIIEESKPLLTGTDITVSSSRQRLLTEYLVASLKLLHPFMPYVSETIWQELPKEMKDSEILMVAKWPAQK